MKKENEVVISRLLGVDPLEMNSALVSAQNRVRLYWANWQLTYPNDRGILLRDIIEDGDCDRDKSYCIDANYYKGGGLKNYLEKSRRQVVMKQRARGFNKGFEKELEKTPPMTSSKWEDNNHIAIRDKSLSQSESRLMVQDGEMSYRKLTPIECERLQTLPDNYTAGVSNTQRYRMLGNGWTVEMIAHHFSTLGRPLNPALLGRLF